MSSILSRNAALRGLLDQHLAALSLEEPVDDPAAYAEAVCSLMK